MAHTRHWDTGSSAPSSGNQGVPRILRKSSGAWDEEWEPRVKVGGSWKRVGKVWTKQSGAWKPVFWAPEVGVSCDYGRLQVDPHHWFYGDIEVKYLGGDPLDGASWSMRMYYQEYQSGTSHNCRWHRHI